MTITANTLFHFTSCIENLNSILEHNLFPRYSLERIPFKTSEKHDLVPRYKSKGYLNFAVPMVSFCDIPLSKVSEHMSTYGRYGIGFAKDWGIRKGLNPILYISSKSQVLHSISEIVTKVVNRSLDVSEENMASLREILCHTKLERGEVEVDSEIQIKEFYKEREWRFVPRIESRTLGNEDGSHETRVRQLMKYFEYDNKKLLDEANSILEKDYCLQFEPRDIKYLIVQTEGEIITLIQKILELKGSRYSFEDVHLLSSRLVSAAQIEEDF